MGGNDGQDLRGLRTVPEVLRTMSLLIDKAQLLLRVAGS